MLPDTARPSVPNRTEHGVATMKTGHGRSVGAIDRRVERTRGLLHDALIALIPERGYAAITVEEICRKANIGRSTFYAHYADKDALRRATMQAHLHALARRRGPADRRRGSRRLEFSLPMFEHAHAFRPLHRALLSSSGDAIHDEVREHIRRAVRDELVGRRVGGRGAPIEFAVQFVTGAFLSVLAWWTAADSKLSPLQIDELFQGMATDGIGRGGA